MAVDAVMLLFGQATGAALWRLYGWSEPAVTFGYSQRWDWVQERLQPFAGACVRRMTGGGIVDHRHDLTYALTLPPTHELFRAPAGGLYRGLHEAIANVLLESGFRAALAPCPGDCEGEGGAQAAGVCFEAPAAHDVIDPVSGIKLAGAAMKRSRSGILVQGSINQHQLQGLRHEMFSEGFGRALAHWLGLQLVEFTGTLPEDLLAEELDRFESRGWNQRR